MPHLKKINDWIAFRYCFSQSHLILYFVISLVMLILRLSDGEKEIIFSKRRKTFDQTVLARVKV